VANKFFRLLIIFFLAFPYPVIAEEVVETETFEDGEQVTDIVVPPTENSLVKIDNTWEYYGGMDGHHLELEYQKHGGTSNDYEFTLPTDHDVYEVGFTIGAMNNEGEVTYNHNDDTSQTNTIDAQTGMNIAQMYEDVVYSVQDTANKFIDSFIITINDWSLVDNIEIKYDSTTTTTLNPLDVQRQANFASYGISETDEERGIREEEEAIIQQEIIQMEIQEAIEVEDNMAETGYSETDEERAEREARTNVTIIVGDEEVTYTEKEQNDGTIERDQERAKNEELYGVALTDEQIERGDLELYDVEEEEIEEDFEIIELTEEEIEEIEYQMELEAKELEILEEEFVFVEDLTEEEFEEFVEVIIDIEEYIDDLEEEFNDFEEEIIIEEDINLIDIFIANDLFPPTEDEIIEDLEKVQDDLIFEDKEEFIDETVEILEDEELVEETVFEVFDVFNTEDEEILTEEEIVQEVEELEEVIEEIIDLPIEIDKDELSEEEILEYEEELEEAIEEYVEELDTDEVIAIVEEINDVGITNLDEVSEETVAIVAEVVEESIEIIQQEEEVLTEEQIEVVQEVLGLEETEDVQKIAEAAKEDEDVQQAVSEFVERAVENADDSLMEYNIADVIVEINYENFVEDPIGSIIDDIQLEDFSFSEIGSDLSETQKEKAQEVVVPVILTRIASLASMVFTRKLG
jgi:hypothetical protein